MSTECAAAMAVRHAAEPVEAVYPLWFPLKKARTTAATACSGGFRCPYAVGSPWASDINSFCGFSLPARSSTILLMGLIEACVMGDARTFDQLAVLRRGTSSPRGKAAPEACSIRGDVNQSLEC